MKKLKTAVGFCFVCSLAFSMEPGNLEKAESIFEDFKGKGSKEKREFLVSNIIHLCKNESRRNMNDILETVLNKLIYTHKHEGHISRYSQYILGESDNLKYASFLVSFGKEMGIRYQNIRGNYNDFKDYVLTDPGLLEESKDLAQRCEQAAIDSSSEADEEVPDMEIWGAFAVFKLDPKTSSFEDVQNAYQQIKMLPNMSDVQAQEFDHSYKILERHFAEKLSHKAMPAPDDMPVPVEPQKNVFPPVVPKTEVSGDVKEAFQFFGLSEDASFDAVSQLYETRLSKIDPSKAGNTQPLKDLDQAYRVLSDYFRNKG